MAGLDLMNYEINGSGLRYENICKASENFIFRFQSNFEDDKFIIYIGEGEPDPNTKIWIKKTNSVNFQDLIQELKKHFDEMPNLDFVGADNFHYFTVSPNMYVLLSRQNTIFTFSNSEDLDQFILSHIGIYE